MLFSGTWTKVKDFFESCSCLDTKMRYQEKIKNHLQIIRKFRLPDNLAIALPFLSEVPRTVYFVPFLLKKNKKS